MAIGTPTSQGSFANGTAASSIVLTISPGINLDEDVFVFAGCQTAGTTCTFTDSAANSYTTDVSANATQDACFFVGHTRSTSVMAEFSTITATFSGSRADQLISAISVTGIAASSPLDKTSVNAQGAGGQSWTSNNTATTTQADELVVGGSLGNFATTQTSTPGANLTELHDFGTVNAVDMTTVYRIVSATGAYSANGTWTGVQANPAVNSGVATYKGASSAAPPGLTPLIFKPNFIYLRKNK